MDWWIDESFPPPDDESNEETAFIQINGVWMPVTIIPSEGNTNFLTSYISGGYVTQDFASRSNGSFVAQSGDTINLTYNWTIE